MKVVEVFFKTHSMNTSYLQIGKTRKIHGIHGHLKMDVQPPYEEGFEKIQVVFIEIGTKKTPYFIEHIDFISGLFLVKLEEIDSKEAAKPLSNRPLFVREKDIEISEFTYEEADASFDQLVGFTILNQAGEAIGIIEDIQEFPQQIMAFVTHNDQETMIPLNDAFIEGINPQTKEITMNLPEGLLEL